MTLFLFLIRAFMLTALAIASFTALAVAIGYEPPVGAGPSPGCLQEATPICLLTII